MVLGPEGTLSCALVASGGGMLFEGGEDVLDTLLGQELLGTDNAVADGATVAV